MQIFRELAGFSFGQADNVCRAMSKKKHAVIDAERQAFIHGDPERGIPGCVVSGPLALDGAISMESVKHKGIHDPVAGQADILLVPFIEIGNVLYKSITYIAGKTMASTICGASCPVIICHKSRERANVVASITAIGDVEGKNIVIVDDLIDTAGTLVKAAEVLMEKGAASVRACATHAVLSGPAYDRINNSCLKEVLVTDTIPLKEGADTSKIKVVSMAETFAAIIRKVYNYEPISTEFIF